MKIGNLEFKNGLFLAPLAGYSDIGFRYLCRKYGADLTYTEMVSVKGLQFKNHKTKDLLAISDAEKPSAVQLFGSDVEAYKCLLDSDVLDKFDIIDVNMGCPVRKIVSNGDGSAMMNDVANSQEVIKTLLKIGKPITCKIRSGFNKVIAPEYAKAMEDAGVSAIAVHGRLQSQLYMGVADWNVIREVKNSVKIPVIGNGDIKSFEDIDKMKNDTGVDGVMIARGAIGNPYIFSNASTENLKQDILIHIKMLLELFGERMVVNSMKKHLSFYSKHLEHNKQLKLDINNQSSLDEMYEIVDRYF